MSEPRKPVKLDGEFQFAVGLEESAFTKQAWWRVYLPHQCDEWDIAYEDTPAEAVAQMELFVAEAQQALDALRRAAADGVLTGKGAE